MQPVRRRRRASLDRLIVEIMLQLPRQRPGRLVAPAAILVERLHHDPIQLAPDDFFQPGRLGAPVSGDGRQRAARTEPRAGFGRLLLADNPQHFIERCTPQPMLVEGSAAREQLVQQYTQGIDIAPRIDVQLIELGLLGTHVFDRPHDLTELRKHGLFGEPLVNRLDDAKIDDLGHRPLVVIGHQHIRGLQVPMNDPFLVCVLHGLAHRNEQLQSLARRKIDAHHSTA